MPFRNSLSKIAELAPLTQSAPQNREPEKKRSLIDRIGPLAGGVIGGAIGYGAGRLLKMPHPESGFIGVTGGILGSVAAGSNQEKIEKEKLSSIKPRLQKTAITSAREISNEGLRSAHKGDSLEEYTGRVRKSMSREGNKKYKHGKNELVSGALHGLGGAGIGHISGGGKYGRIVGGLVGAAYGVGKGYTTTKRQNRNAENIKVALNHERLDGTLKRRYKRDIALTKAIDKAGVKKRYLKDD